MRVCSSCFAFQLINNQAHAQTEALNLWTLQQILLSRGGSVMGSCTEPYVACLEHERRSWGAHISRSYGPFISTCDASYTGDPPGYTDCTLSTETVSVLLHLSRKTSMKVICILFSAFLLFWVLFQGSIEVESFDSRDFFLNMHLFGIITSGWLYERLIQSFTQLIHKKYWFIWDQNK